MYTTPSTQTNTKTEYPLIDILKFIGALLVVAIHTAPFSSVNSLLNHGVNNFLARTAIPIYFVSSGYFLFKKTSLNHFNISIPINYCKKILNLYILWTLIYLPLIIRGIIKQKSILPFLQNLIFSGTYDHLWYLGATIVAVMLISLLINYNVKLKTIIFIASTLFIIGLLFQTYAGIIEIIIPNTLTAKNITSTICDLIITTRNGLFFGFPFILLGAIFAYKKVEIKNNFAITGLITSLLFLFVEALTVQYFHWAIDYNLYIFLIPFTFFIFYLALAFKLKPKNIYKKLRTFGILIYFVHPIFIYLFSFVSNSLLKYLLVIVSSIVFAECVYSLSKNRNLKFLIKLYS